jgi:hypothetical protein
MTSPPCVLHRSDHDVGLIEFLKNFTLSSHMPALTPPG